MREGERESPVYALASVRVGRQDDKDLKGELQGDERNLLLRTCRSDFDADDVYEQSIELKTTPSADRLHLLYSVSAINPLLRTPKILNFLSSML